jgi:TM2 domain-containing membrane protein YozV
LFCCKCGAQLSEGSAFCPKCGASLAPAAEKMAADISQKSRLATTLLAWFLGYFGAHRFYTGKTGTAVIMLLMGILAGVCWFGGVFSSLGVVGDTSFSGVIVGMIAFMIVGGLLYSAVWVWSIIDFIIAVTGNFKDSQGKVIKRW